jgi:hypothetical protein
MITRASCPVFMFRAPAQIFYGTTVIGSRFYVLRSRNRFGRFRGHQVPFSCFALPDSFSAVPWASGPVFLFCATELILDGTDGVGSRFYVLRSRTRLRQYGGYQIPFSCFASPYSFSIVAKELGPVFMFCAPRLVFDGSGGVMSRFHVLRPRTRFRRYGGRWVPFSCFALLDSFSANPRASGPVFMFCVPILIFGGSEGVVSYFHVLRPRTRFWQFEGVMSRFHVLRSRTRLRRFRGHRFPFP